MKPIKFNKKPPKLLSQQMKKRYYKTLGICVINSTMSPSSLIKTASTLLHWQLLNVLKCLYNQKDILKYLLKVDLILLKRFRDSKNYIRVSLYCFWIVLVKSFIIFKCKLLTYLILLVYLTFQQQNRTFYLRSYSYSEIRECDSDN